MKTNLFLGHFNDVAEGSNKPLKQFEYKKSLITQNGEPKLIQNVCPHQGSLICSKHSTNTRCQYHGWEWDNNGDPVSAGHTKHNNKFKLKISNLSTFKELLFSMDISIPELENVDLSNLRLYSERLDTINADWKNIIDIFLDVDHIPVVHMGVYDRIDITATSEIDWNYYDWGSVQSVWTHDHSEVMAIWVTVYPYVTIEWQNGSFFVTNLYPQNDGTTLAQIMKYGDNNKQEINDTIFEEAWVQDMHQASVIVAKSMNEQYLEEGKIHFRNFLKDNEMV
jgi:nitrite reductase/ring-hydroxylating ferredoxin subunit